MDIKTPFEIGQSIWAIGERNRKLNPWRVIASGRVQEIAIFIISDQTLYEFGIEDERSTYDTGMFLGKYCFQTRAEAMEECARRNKE